MIWFFVDTGAWFTSVVPWDANQKAASEWLAQNTRSVLTTDGVFSETLTLLRIRGERDRANWLGERIWAEELAVLYFVNREEQEAAWDVYRHVDCFSKVGMERLDIDTAFSFDHHFQQFGTVRVVP